MKRSPGPRRAALAERRRSRRRRKVVAGTFAVIVGAAAAGAATFLVADRVLDGRDAPRREEAAVTQDAVSTTLLFGTREDARASEGAVWLTLLTLDRDAPRGSVVYIPAHTAAEIPGRGLQDIGNALATGGIPLLLVSVEGLLDVEVDRVIEVSDRDALVWLEHIGELSVDVPADLRVPAGRDRTRLLLPRGRQLLDAGFLVDALYTVGVEDDDVALGLRHIAFWSALFDRFSDHPEELAHATRQAGPALTDADADLAAHARMLRALAALGPGDRAVTSLPVRQVSVGGDELYAVDQEELAAFLEEFVGEHAAPGDRVRIQVLNGNGVPGIGQEVAERLVGEGFRVILSGNARRLDYQTTRIVTYDSSPRGERIAERARELLGVGEIQVSVQQQGIVDLTIVVGMDFLETR